MADEDVANAVLVKMWENGSLTIRATVGATAKPK